MLARKAQARQTFGEGAPDSKQQGEGAFREKIVFGKKL
jgi:hypothetical protein